MLVLHAHAGLAPPAEQPPDHFLLRIGLHLVVDVGVVASLGHRVVGDFSQLRQRQIQLRLVVDVLQVLVTHRTGIGAVLHEFLHQRSLLADAVGYLLETPVSHALKTAGDVLPKRRQLNSS